MKEIIVAKKDDGITLAKFLKKVFVKMPQSTFYKLIRKKYFEINGKKSNGKETLKTGDRVTIFLSDETYKSFIKNDIAERRPIDNKGLDLSALDLDNIKKRIIYEDDNIILYNKEVGLISQGDKSGALSVNTILNKYLGSNDDSTYLPSVVNRLDRNTSGIIIFAKTYMAAKEISMMIKNGLVDKHYMAVVNGEIKSDIGSLTHLLKKDEKRNISIIKDYEGKVPNGFSKVSLNYIVLKKNKDISVVDIKLLTGKSHQIRAEFAYIGHPLVGDKKYMPNDLYKANVKKYGTKTQELMCYKIRFGEFNSESLSNLNNKEFKIKEGLICNLKI